MNSVIKIGDWKGQMTELYKLLGIKPDQKWEFESSKLEPCETSVHSRIGENMADLSEIPTTVRDSDSVDVVAPDVQRVDFLDEGGHEFGGGDGMEEEGVNYEDDMFEIDEEGGEEEDYEDDG